MASPLQINNNKNSYGYLTNIINWIFKYDYLVIFIGFGIVILASILLTVVYEETENMRHVVLFNNILAVIVGFFFLYLVFTFMGQNIKILGYNIDFGLILFLTLGIFIIFVLGD
jgi:hypothetical protein